MGITIRDVARACDCSITTVSLVLNNKTDNISERTRQRILQTAEEMNYRPNRLAVGMITQKTSVLGLIIPDNENPFFATLSKAVESAASSAGYSLLYGNSVNNPARDIAYFEMFAAHKVDGIIYAQSSDGVNESESGRVLALAEKAGIPLVTVDRQVDGGITPTVRADHFKGGYMAARHLLDLGHRRIGCFTGPKNLTVADDRAHGYQTALQEAGLEPCEELMFEGDYRVGRGEAALLHFLNQKASAIFSCNDLMAYDLLGAARRFHVAVPDEISIVGFDDVWLSDIIYPRLTTISQPIMDMGACVVDILIKMIGHENTVREKVFEPKLCIRDSTARPGYYYGVK